MTMVSLPSYMAATSLAAFAHHRGNGAFRLERRFIERAIAGASMRVELHGPHESEQLTSFTEFFVHPAPALFAQVTGNVPRARENGGRDASPAGIRLRGRDGRERAAHQAQMRVVP